MDEFVHGFFAVGQFDVRKNVSFGKVRLGQIRLGSVNFFSYARTVATAKCPTAKNPRAG